MSAHEQRTSSNPVTIAVESVAAEQKLELTCTKAGCGEKNSGANHEERSRRTHGCRTEPGRVGAYVWWLSERRRVGRCPHHNSESLSIAGDVVSRVGE